MKLINISILSVSLLGVLTACNFHVADKKVLYRADQLSGKEFKKQIKKYKIKTVINLRGISRSAKWYKEEEKALRETNTLLFNYSMSASRLPHRDDLIGLIDTLRTAPRPILVHCKAGADRTGEAVAMWYMEYKKMSAKKASKEALRVRYHHLRTFTPAKTYFIEKIYRGMDWAIDNYDPCAESSKFKYYDKAKYCKNGALDLQMASLEEEDLDGLDMFQALSRESQLEALEEERQLDYWDASEEADLQKLLRSFPF